MNYTATNENGIKSKIFSQKVNVMKSRAYDANDCAFSLNRLVNKNKWWKTENTNNLKT